jgi:hypothetical protein
MEYLYALPRLLFFRVPAFTVPSARYPSSRHLSLSNTLRALQDPHTRYPEPGIETQALFA